MISVILDAQNVKPFILPEKIIEIPFDSSDKDHFYHYALLSALDYGVQSISRISNQKYEIDYYPNNDLIYFEYEKEYRQDKCFSASTRDIDLWNHIVNILNTSKCELTIEPRFSTLSMLGKIEKQGGAFDE